MQIFEVRCLPGLRRSRLLRGNGLTNPCVAHVPNPLSIPNLQEVISHPYDLSIISFGRI